MKKKLILTISITLLLIIVAWIIHDLFKESRPVINPYDYGMKELRNEKKTAIYTESIPLNPGMEEITSLAVDRNGKIFVAGPGAVAILDPHGRLLTRFSITGDPTALTIPAKDAIVIGMTDHIEIYNQKGTLISKWNVIDPQTIITSLAVSQGHLIIADAGKKVVYKFGLDGKFQSRIGEKDPVRKIPGFIIPSPFFDVGISPSAELWVANTGRHQLEKYDLEGTLLSTWGAPSQDIEGFAGCCNPSHFTFLPDGSFITSEKGIERIKRYSPAGKFIELIAGPGSFDEGTKGLDLATDSSGRIIVLDPARNQIRIFIPKK